MIEGEFILNGVCLSVHPSWSKKMINVWKVRPIWLNFHGNFWVDSTNAQSPLGSTWPGSMNFPWSLAAPWLLGLPSHVILESISQLKQPWQRRFLNLSLGLDCGLQGGTTRGVDFFRFGQFFIKLLKLNFKRCVFLAFRFQALGCKGEICMNCVGWGRGLGVMVCFFRYAFFQIKKCTYTSII